MAEPIIDAQVAYAEADRQIVLEIRVPRGTTVSGAIDAARLAEILPTGSIDGGRIGIFARKVALDHVIEQGDRIEIYRPLPLDPMDARRRRAR